MSKIYTVTLNPALDISGVVDCLKPNEKNYVHEEIRTPGGNGINAAIIAWRLGADVEATGFLGGQTGDEIEKLIDIEKLQHNFISIEDKTRMNITVTDRSKGQQTRLSFPGPQVNPQERQRLEQYLQTIRTKDFVLFGGSLPPSLTSTDLSQMVQDLINNEIVCFVDVPGEILAHVIDKQPYFIKPNLTEFQILTGTNVDSISSVLPIIRELNQKVSLVCVSSVEGGAILARKDEVWFGKIPDVEIKSSVGAGDSMVGGMMALLQRNRDAPVESLLREGLAAACATLTETQLNLGTRNSIDYYRPLIFMRKLH